MGSTSVISAAYFLLWLPLGAPRAAGKFWLCGKAPESDEGSLTTHTC